MLCSNILKKQGLAENLENMSSFEIIKEFGFTAILREKEGMLPPTPWLLSVDEGLKLNQVRFEEFTLGSKGIRSIISHIGDNDNLGWDVPEFTILTPLLTPLAKRLEKSIRYELDLFLDRLEECKLPSFFGLVYSPIYTREYLKELLEFGPSFLAVQFDDLDTKPINDLLQIIIELRGIIPRNVAMYIPGGIGLGIQTMLIALGVDILDETVAYRMAAKRKLLEDGFEKHLDSDHDFINTVRKNLAEIRTDFYGIKQSIKDNSLWTRVAREMHASPRAATLLSLFNQKYIKGINLYKFPQWEKNKLFFTGDEGLYHPEVMAFRQRIISRYIVDNDKKVVLLLPCSARKPYKLSKSHNIFEKTIGDALRHKRDVVEIWSLTSPLGVVPRAVETVYPAAYYDIPVTGFWTEKENKICGLMLKQMLDKVDKDVQIIVHVSKGYEGMVNFAIKDRDHIVSWIDDKPTSEMALSKLKSTLQAVFGNEEINTRREKALVKQARRDIPNLVRYVHGENCELDLENMRLVGRPPRAIQIQLHGEHYLTWDQLIGEIRLSPQAALDIACNSQNWVLLDADKLTGSSVFGAGVFKASLSISPGDEVLLFNKDKTFLLGVGNALISGDSMNDVDYGRVASLRKKCLKEVGK